MGAIDEEAVEPFEIDDGTPTHRPWPEKEARKVAGDEERTGRRKPNCVESPRKSSNEGPPELPLGSEEKKEEGV